MCALRACMSLCRRTHSIFAIIFMWYLSVRAAHSRKGKAVDVIRFSPCSWGQARSVGHASSVDHGGAVFVDTLTACSGCMHIADIGGRAQRTHVHNARARTRVHVHVLEHAHLRAHTRVLSECLLPGV